MPENIMRKIDLLKPPETKPVWTLLVILIFFFNVGDTGRSMVFNIWCSERSITAQKFFQALQTNERSSSISSGTPFRPSSKGGKSAAPVPVQKNDLPDFIRSIPFSALLAVCFSATSAQLGPFTLIFNCLYWWIFAVPLEKRLLSWRFPVFLLTGLLGSWALLFNEASTHAPSQNFIGPIMFLCYVMGGYIVFRPRKPFKPADWKPAPWKVFKGDDVSKERKVKAPYVSPWVYIFMFFGWIAIEFVFASFSGNDLRKMSNLSFLGDARNLFMSTVPPGYLQVIHPVPALESAVFGAISSYALSKAVLRYGSRRRSDELQLQAVLQYKHLRALDMNHRQAVEGAAKLLSVPVDIANDWISKGLQVAPPEEKS